MSLCGYKLIVGTDGRKIVIWDLRNMASAQQTRESSLEYQTRCIRAFPNCEGFAVSSVGGNAYPNLIFFVLVFTIFCC